MPWYLDEKKTHLMKETRCFIIKKKIIQHITILEKKIATILEGFIKDNSKQRKDQLFLKLKKEAFLFHHYSCQRTYFIRVFLLFNIY